MALHDIERRQTNRSGGAKYGNGLHPTSLYSKESNSTASGSTGINASMRSRIPPWPGSRLLLSFISARRFNCDSNKSPAARAAAGGGGGGGGPGRPGGGAGGAG